MLALVLFVVSFGVAPGATAQEVPSPEDVLGYPIGERFTDVAGVERYFEALAEASDLVTLDRYGETVEGRPLLQAVVASPENRARLDEIQRLNRELMDPDTPEDRAREIAEANPAIAYFTYAIHGNESSSPESAMWTAWDLARGAPSVDGVLESVVVVIDPVANPDGRDRFVNWYRQAALGRDNPNLQIRERREPWPGGRFNHYLFDLNRDWAWVSQPETEARLLRYQEWNPQVHIDFHEMGYNANYFFFPAADPVNPIFPEHITEWGRRFGDANARAFDEVGRLYYTGENFDLFYPGYGDSWPSLQGAIGMTYEQAGGGFGGRTIERADGTVLTLEHRARGHWITGAATLRETAAGKEDLLLGFAGFHREIDEGLADYLLVPGTFPGPVEALVETLVKQGVEVERAGEEFSASAEAHPGFEARSSFPEGTYRVRARQPRGRLAGALLQPEHDLEGQFSYDITAWSLPYAYGVEAHAVAGTPSAGWMPVREVGGDEGWSLPERGRYGYLVEPGFAPAPALVRFLEEGGRAVLLPDTFALDGREHPRGTLFLAQGRNDELDRRIQESGLAPHVRPVHRGFTEWGPDLGTASGTPIRLPRVALLGGDGTTPTSAGAHWFFLERTLDIPFDMINVSDVASVEIDGYDVIIVPSGGGALRSELGQGGVDRLEEWVRAGGTLIAVAGAAQQLAEPLAGVEERAELDEEELERDERLQKALRTREERELAQWIDRIPGTILQVRLDPDHPLSYGAASGGTRDRMFVLSSGTVFEPADDVESPAFFPEGLEKVAGMISDDNLERMDRGAWITHARRGQGSVVLFADEPLFRMFWYAGFQPYTNAILLAPAL